MKRPHLVHFMAIVSDESINIRASVTLKENLLAKNLEIDLPSPPLPMQALRMLNAYQFTMKIVGFTKEQKEIYKKSFESDSFGNFNLKIPLIKEREEIDIIQVYETKKRPGLELHLGTYMPIRVNSPNKIIICDFDKTLVDTKYQTAKEVYQSLTRSIEVNPTVSSSVDLIRKYIQQDFHPFILSASPHFYEDSIRDWLYKNNIFTSGIFLKDYRHFFSFLDGDLTARDLKIQGLYKLNHLLDILLMTGIPDHLVLMGDNFESDPTIYLTLSKILLDDIDPWIIWNDIKKQDLLEIKKKQTSQLLNKIYQIDNMVKRQRRLKRKNKTEIKIFIRKRFKDDELKISPLFKGKKHHFRLIQMYDGLYQKEFEALKLHQENNTTGE